MRHLRLATLIATLIATLATPLAAQDDAETDKGYIETWLEDALSEAGRAVTVTGFEGALSSNATLEVLTIADDQGVWFTMRDASLKWSRSALVSGRLEVSELSAAEIVLDRLPDSGGDRLEPADSEAWQFSLPDLPVSVDIDGIRADAIRLGPAVLGEPAALSLAGDFSLADGTGAAMLDIRRTDRNDSLAFQGAFSNATRNLTLDFDFTEARGGLVSALLGIPDAPALRLQVSGDAPLSDFAARVALSSEGENRFGGAVTISAITPGDGAEAAPGHAFSASLSGDVRPLFTPDLHVFFGDNAELTLSGARLQNGRVTLDRLHLASGAMRTTGSLVLLPGGWPERFALEGAITGEGRVRLPIAGLATTIRGASFTAAFDADRGSSWQADATLTGLTRGPLQVARAQLTGSGLIGAAAGQSITADLAFEMAGLRHDDTALARAIGAAPSGTASLSWQADAPLNVGALTLQSGDLRLTASGRIDSLSQGFPVTGRAVLRSSDLSRFAGLAGRDIAGAASATVAGSGQLLGGAFDIELDATTQDLKTGEPALDRLLVGDGMLALAARRDMDGTVLDRLTLRTPALAADATGRLDSDSGQIDLAAQLPDIALVEPRLSGPADLETALRWTLGDRLHLSRLRADLAGATLTGSGALWPEDPALPVAGQLHFATADLSRFAALAGTPLAGQLTLALEGSGEIRGDRRELTAEMQGEGVRSGMAELDRLVAGQVSLDTSLALGGDVPDLRYLKLVSPRLRANATGSGVGAPVAVSLRIADLGILAPGFSGPASARGEMTLLDRTARRLNLALDAVGPGGAVARIAGELGDYGQSLALGVQGTAPLGLINRFIAPRSIAGPASFDLRLDGPPRLASLSGRIATGDARLSLPSLRAALSALRGTLTLGSGQAEVDMTGTAGTGGGFRLVGPVTLAPPHTAALEATLSDLGISDPALYSTTVSGSLSLTGPLTGGARIGGALSLGQTELRVPSGSDATPGAIPDIRHVGEPAAVAATRQRAGLTGQGRGMQASFPLDLSISAPNRIFVRGRGLDAELGGALRLGGTTSNVSASGVFELIRGRLDILGRRLVLSEGLIDLRGALDPYLRFVAETAADDIVVRVIIEGLASAPRVSFTSEPDLPQEEAVARLLFGRGLDSVSPFQAAQIVAAAATLSGQRSGGLTGRLRDTLGLSDIDVSTSKEGTSQLRVGAYVTENVYSEVTADNEGNQEINLNLDLTPSLTVKGRTSTTGNTGLGVFFERDY